MQILGASMMQVTMSFLHPGYISAYPRTFSPEMGYPLSYGDPTLQMDMVSALHLQGDPVASAGHVSTPLTTSLAGLSGVSTAVMAALCFFGCLVLWALLREHVRGRFRAAFTLPPLMAMALWVVTCGPDPLPTQKPWEGVQVRAYANPSQATLAILHGIIADGIINVGQRVDTLANIQNEVGLPTATPSEGMAYALSTYGLDGWGREFRLSRADRQYTVTSAGADGAFDTADDLAMVVSQCDNGSWDNSRHAFFLRRSGTDHLLFVHRWTGDFFRYENRDDAEAMTGTRLFDVLRASDMYEDLRVKVEASYSQDASGVSDDPIVLQVFGTFQVN